MAHSTRFGFDLPDDFPLDPLEAVHARVSDGARSIHANNEPLWLHWAGGCNGAMYRFIDAAHASDDWVASSSVSLTPPAEERAKQEIALFSFFTGALSSLECLVYGLCAIGEWLSAAFTVTTKPTKIKFPFGAKTFTSEFPSDPLGPILTATDQSFEMSSLRETRNILAHRATPGRIHSETLTSGGSAVEGPTLWMGQPLGPATTTAPRQWVSQALADILSAADAFTQNHL